VTSLTPSGVKRGREFVLGEEDFFIMTKRTLSADGLRVKRVFWFGFLGRHIENS